MNHSAHFITVEEPSEGPKFKPVKPVFRHEGITFSRSFWKGTTTITIDYPKIVAGSVLREVKVDLIKNGEFLPISTTEPQTFIMKRSDNWTINVHSSSTDPDGGRSSAFYSITSTDKSIFK